MNFNLDKLAENTSTQAAQKSVAVRAIHQQPVVERHTPATTDMVDMSMIGRLMARSVRILADNDEVRPEVIAKHQQLPKQNVRFDDNTLDRIFRRMQAP